MDHSHTPTPFVPYATRYAVSHRRMYLDSLDLPLRPRPRASPTPIMRSRCGRARCHRPWRLATPSSAHPAPPCPVPIARPVMRTRGAVGISYGFAARWGHRALPHITPAKFPLSRIPWCGPVACHCPSVPLRGAPSKTQKFFVLLYIPHLRSLCSFVLRTPAPHRRIQPPDPTAARHGAVPLS